MYLIKLKDHVANEERIINISTDYQNYIEHFNFIIDTLNESEEFTSSISSGVAEISRYVTHVNLGYLYNTTVKKLELVYTLSLIQIDERFGDFSDSSDKSSSRISENSDSDSGSSDPKVTPYLNFLKDSSSLFYTGNNEYWTNSFINELKLKLTQPNCGLSHNTTTN